MASASLYPPSPVNVPAGITRPGAAYRLRVVGMILGLFLFLLVYLVFIAAAGLLAYWLLALPLPELGGRGMFVFLVLKFGGALAAILLWVFLVKGLFKGHRVERSAYLALDEREHPQLFDFIRRVYQDTGSPRPRRVYVSPDVNAALVYDTSLLNLIVPPRKDLLIGLGLVNVVNLAEFKAVLAHEFGHFSQRSVGLGNYLYVANRVMHDVIYGRDALDRFVDTWSAQDLRVSFPAWGLKGVLFVVRKILGGVFEGLNVLHLSLSRQMEFNADNVAVRVTGSDSLIHCLARLEFAAEALADAARSLDAAADHGLFTDDVFFHQTRSMARLRHVRKEERAGIPPELPANPLQQVQVFQLVDDGVPERYRSHPTDFMREQNAKRIYIRSPLDDRSPWLLFEDPAALKRLASRQFYQHALDRRENYVPRPADEVQRFIDAEIAETTYDARYHGLFDFRFIDPGDVENLPAPWSREEQSAWLASWPPADLEQQVAACVERQSEMQVLQGLQSGELTLKGSKFHFRESECSLGDVRRLVAQVGRELDESLAAFHQLDRQMFLAHWSLARQALGQAGESELLGRYRFHMKVQSLLQELLGEEAQLHFVIQALSGHTQLSEEDFRQVRAGLSKVYETLAGKLQAAKSIFTPELTNVVAGTSLYDLIADRDKRTLSPPRLDEISGEWLNSLATRLAAALTRLRRVNFKSMGSLLAFQERLGDMV